MGFHQSEKVWNGKSTKGEGILGMAHPAGERQVVNGESYRNKGRSGMGDHPGTREGWEWGIHQGRGPDWECGIDGRGWVRTGAHSPSNGKSNENQAMNQGDQNMGISGK